MSGALDLTNIVFGRLTALERVPNASKGATWRCRCECGNEKIVKAEYLRSGNCKSCGCLRRENTGAMFTKHGATKGPKWTPEYRAWVSMNTRCKYDNRPDHKWYGSQGVVVCPEWQVSFEAFFGHVGPRPSDKHSLDRINPYGNYEPGNVRWATSREQNLNKRVQRPWMMAEAK